MEPEKDYNESDPSPHDQSVEVDNFALLALKIILLILSIIVSLVSLQSLFASYSNQPPVASEADLYNLIWRIVLFIIYLLISFIYFGTFFAKKNILVNLCRMIFWVLSIYLSLSLLVHLLP